MNPWWGADPRWPGNRQNRPNAPPLFRRNGHGGHPGLGHNHRRARQEAFQAATRVRRISVPVWWDARISASPAMQPNELYVFPVRSQRIRLVQEDNRVVMLRVPDMSIADLMDRLLVDHRRHLWVGIHDGLTYRLLHVLHRSSRSVLSEMWQPAGSRDRCLIVRRRTGW